MAKAVWPTLTRRTEQMLKLTNREVAMSREFGDLCKRFNVVPTKRQASKFALGRGLLYRRMLEARKNGHADPQ